MKITKRDIAVFAIGLVVMFFLDMAFDFNNKHKRAIQKEKRKIENLFKK